MADSIYNEISSIKNAKFGSEVRKPLADALSTINGGSIGGFVDHGDLPNYSDLDDYTGSNAMGIYRMLGSYQYHNSAALETSQMAILYIYSWGSYTRQVMEYMSNSSTIAVRRFIRCYVNGIWSPWYYKDY